MKLRNKKTGEIVETDYKLSISIPDDEKFYGCKTYNELKGYSSLAELNEEWEDYEEPEGWWFIGRDYRPYATNSTLRNRFADEEIGNYFTSKEEAEKAVEKLKAWKRLKDKGFEFCNYSALGSGEIDFRIDFEPLSDEAESVRQDLDLLFGGEE